ncbi:hypothetical protein MCOR25_003747 [Pyricularia grisea]|uniref:Uncharacterized protein n=1 Tax=Pyricularia grisea TaxID=148305 RepID=A0A6P8BCP5_PYRGI|nr:uncharacterized protein PgNI_04964 [Pyricularia grisea]KAI6372426.1 hypothetical protein MCOR25_003747 [Pyricularia grisea]TLD13590.1 hypothetical protein PgNI_04964 [Pyricularia grisea]
MKFALIALAIAFANTPGNYRMARKCGGESQVQLHPCGALTRLPRRATGPATRGDRSDYERFLDCLIRNVKASGMIPGLKVDVWNEPNLDCFWKRSLDRWLELWIRTVRKFRSDPELKPSPHDRAPPSPGLHPHDTPGGASMVYRTGDCDVQVRNLDKAGFPGSGSVTIQIWGFDDTGARGQSDGPSDHGQSRHNYSGGLLRIPISQTAEDRTTAWVFELWR